MSELADYYCDHCGSRSSETHIPNKDTEQAMVDSEERKDLESFSTLKELWEHLGLSGEKD